MDMRNQERWRRFAAVLLLLLIGAYQLVVSAQFYQQIRWPENVIDEGFALIAPWPSVTRVKPRPAEAGLKAGDRILEVQGQPYAGEYARQIQMDKLFPGDRIRLTVAAPGQPSREVSWQLENAGGGHATAGRIVFLCLMTIGMPLLCLLIGFWVVMARPADNQAWLLMAMLVAFSHSIVQPTIFTGYGLPGAMLFELHPLLRGLWGMSMFLFAWEFPRRTAWQERWNPFLRIVICILLACAAHQFAEGVLHDWPTQSPLLSILERFSGWVQFFQMTAISGFFALLAAKRAQLPDPDSRRRLTTIFRGAVLSMTPLFVLVLISLSLGIPLDSGANWAVLPALLAMCFFPVTLAYVIVVHRAFGLSMVLRQGLQYALARRGVRVLQILFVISVIFAAVLLVTQPGMNRPRILQVVALGTAFVFLLQVAAERLSQWIDRRFFREAYNAEQLLTSLSEDVRSMVETRPLLEAVATRITQAMHVQNIVLFLNQNGQFQPAYATGAASPLAESSRTAAVLLRDRTYQRVYLDDPSSWTRREGLPPDEINWLNNLGAELLLPLTVKTRLLGFIGLGRKRSEEPYTPNDVRLLQSVALQTGLALENSQLAAAVTDAVAQRERMNRELEIAHEVQERLFPQNLPEIEGLDYWGYCRPAKGVGGDSYDFLKLENGEFVISIGDVSGKGIPAALLMASLQSALRGQAMSLPADLGAMIATLNRLIFDSSPDNRYATLFYSQYNPATRLLTYVNGGHCPPIVLRGRQVFRLEEGGPVVGLFRPAKFTHGTFQMEKGDLLIGFTDGVSEAMNANDDEWGEDALAEFLKATPLQPVRDLIPKIIAAADHFANGHPQHDDMTLIAVRL